MALTVSYAGVLALALGVTMSSANPQTPDRPAIRSTTEAPAAERHVPLRFDIHAQPLTDALERLAAITRWSAFYRTETIAGVQAAALQGWYTPDAVLRMLVDRSGLVVQYTAADAFVLEPLGGLPTSAAPVASPRDTVQEGLLQAGMREVFCRDARIAPGDYRVAVSFQLDGTGRVVQPALLDSTGDRDRDTAILDGLRQVRTGRAPTSPAQPFVMLIVPEATRDCTRP
jgi:hypothetical protein